METHNQAREEFEMRIYSERISGEKYGVDKREIKSICLVCMLISSKYGKMSINGKGHRVYSRPDLIGPFGIIKLCTIRYCYSILHSVTLGQILYKNR